MMHPRRVTHLEIDLIGVKETDERPESEEDSPLQPVNPRAGQPPLINAISYPHTVFHPFIIHGCHPCLIVYSLRSASMGSMPVARSAGMKQAAPATNINTKETAANVTGSDEGVANSSAPISLLSASAPTIPTVKPISTSVIPCRITIARMPVRVAPNAMRIPISRVRCVTDSAITPVRPAAVIISARTAKRPSSQTVRRGDATESSRTCCSVLT